MTDFRFSITSEDRFSDQLRLLRNELRSIEAQFARMNQMAQALDTGPIEAMHKLSDEAERLRRLIGAMTNMQSNMAAASGSAAAEMANDVKRITREIQASSDAWPVWYQKMSDAARRAEGISATSVGVKVPHSGMAEADVRAAVLRAETDAARKAAQEQERIALERNRFTNSFYAASGMNIAAHYREQEQQIRQLTGALDKYYQEQFKFQESIAPTDNVAQHYREQAEAIKRATQEQEKLNLEQFKYQESIAAKSNVSEHYREQEALIRRATDALRRYNQEQVQSEREAFKFAQTIAPQMKVRFVTSGLGKLRAIPTDLENVAIGSRRASREMRHLVAMFDEAASGRRGQFFATLGAAARDANLPIGALGVAVGGLMAIMAASRFSEFTERMGEFAQKTRINAQSVGMSVKDFSELEQVMKLAGGSSQDLSRVFGVLSEQIEEGINNPTSKARDSFNELGISLSQLADGLQHPANMIELLREKWQRMGDSLERTRVFHQLFGRQFEQLVPYLEQTDEELARNKQAATETGSVLDTQLAQGLEKAAVASRRLSEAMQGLGEHFTAMSGSTGVLDWLTRMVESLNDAATGWYDLTQSQNKWELFWRAFSDSFNPFNQNAIDEDYAQLHLQGPDKRTIEQIKMDESGGNYQAIGPVTKQGGHYGAYQFDDPTWREASAAIGQGGKYAHASDAPPEVQDAAARWLQRQRGNQPWAASFKSPNPRSMFDDSAPHEGHGYQGEKPLPFNSAQALRKMNEELKVLHQQTALKEAEYNKQIALAGSNKEQANAIEAEKIQYLEGQVKKEQSIRQSFAAQRNDPQQKDLFLEGNQAQVQLVNLQTQAIRQAAQAANDQLRAQKNILEAEEAAAKTPEKVLAIKKQIAAIDAQMASNDAEAASIQQREVAQAQKEYDLKKQQQMRQSAELGDQLGNYQARINTSRDQALVAQHKLTTQQMIENEAQTTEAIAEQSEARWQAIANASEKGSDAWIQAESKIAEISDQTTAKLTDDLKRLSDEAKKSADKFNETFTDAFNSIGEGLKGALDSEIKGMIEGFSRGTQQVQLFQTTAANGLPIVAERIKTVTAQQQIFWKLEEAAGKAALDMFLKLGEQLAAQGLAKLLGVGADVASKGLSAVLGNAIGGLFGNVTGAATSAATTAAPITAAIATQTGTLTAATTALGTTLATTITTGDTAIVTAINTSAAINAVTPKPFGFALGGIVPSAAGGMVVNDGRGGQLSILHPQEMVLPAHISNGMQAMINKQSFGHNVSETNEASGDTHFHIHAIDTKTGAEFLMKHASTILRSASKASRNNTLSMRTL